MRDRETHPVRFNVAVRVRVRVRARVRVYSSHQYNPENN